MNYLERLGFTANQMNKRALITKILDRARHSVQPGLRVLGERLKCKEP
jgi:hypothetical protein